MDCGKCGASNSPGLAACAYCGAAFATAAAVSAPTGAEPASGRRDWSGEKPYYQVAFAEFDKTVGDTWQVKWNWAAFFFSWIWYLARGMPAKGLILLGVSIVLSFGLAWWVVSIYTGLYGTWDLYQMKAKGKQTWW